MQICIFQKNNSREGIAFAGFINESHIKLIHIHKTTKGWAAKGKYTMGWFYRFKLHLIIYEMGEIIQWQLTPENVDNRAPLKDSEFTEKLFGKLFADRGYISQDLFEKLFVDDIHLVTKIKKNMNNSHLVVVISARKGSLSYNASFEKLPSQIDKFFADSNLVVLYPEQFNQPEDMVSFSDPMGHNESQHYENAREWITGLLNIDEE